MDLLDLPFQKLHCKFHHFYDKMCTLWLIWRVHHTTDQSYTDEILQSVTWAKILTPQIEDMCYHIYCHYSKLFFCHGQTLGSRPILTHPGALLNFSLFLECDVHLYMWHDQAEWVICLENSILIFNNNHLCIQNATFWSKPHLKWTFGCRDMNNSLKF